MNIFVLDYNPRVAAMYHCDQHMNKMIVESAQLLSTALRLRGHNNPALMRSAYEHHPCTLWLVNSFDACDWVAEMATFLETMRGAASENAASAVVRVARQLLLATASWKNLSPEQFIYVGDSSAKGEDVTARYQQLYLIKRQQWAARNRFMSYKHRPIPPFLHQVFRSKLDWRASKEELTYFYEGNKS